MDSPTPPILHGPSSKEKKYDRQLRLWAASGQAALEDARLLLINSGPGVVGVETVKNLVLPGMGHFTIQDSAVVTEADLGVNFFLEDHHLGGSRAEHTCNLLKELNPDVQGSFITEPVETFLSSPDALEAYTHIIVAAPIDYRLLEQISSHAQRTGIPVFYIRSVGFYAQFSIHLPPAFPIVDTHPESTSTQDLRLLNPWPALLDLAKHKTEGLEEMDDGDHGHIPYVLLLLYYLEVWKAEHDGRAPQAYKDKAAFKAMVSKVAAEENYEEAVGAVLKSFNPPSISSAVKDVFNADECTNLTSSSPSFWIIARAIAIFYDNNAVLPLPGSVPDMKARSKDYIELQNTYKSKARLDIGEVTATVRTLEKELGRPLQIEDSEIESFCKGAAHVKLIRGRPFHVIAPGKMPAWTDRAKAMANELTNPDCLLALYIAFQAYDSWYSTGRFGSAPAAILAEKSESEAENLISIADAIIDDLIKQAGKSIDGPDLAEIKETTANFVREIVRAGGSELHNISSLAGGIISQEVIKVITKQYVPVDNTCMFDGISSKTSVLRF